MFYDFVTQPEHTHTKPIYNCVCVFLRKFFPIFEVFTIDGPVNGFELDGTSFRQMQSFHSSSVNINLHSNKSEMDYFQWMVGTLLAEYRTQQKINCTLLLL